MRVWPANTLNLVISGLLASGLAITPSEPANATIAAPLASPLPRNVGAYSPAQYRNPYQWNPPVRTRLVSARACSSGVFRISGQALLCTPVNIFNACGISAGDHRFRRMGGAENSGGKWQLNGWQLGGEKI